ncbi:MAG: TIGR00725 family protein [Nitrospinae bacterium]|nr:TIGR00725 family protein [Nitrospinota bacterium]
MPVQRRAYPRISPLGDFSSPGGRPQVKILIAVVGDSKPSGQTERLAEQVGRCLAERGAALVCGGLGGVMEAAGRGAKAAGGLTVGILPGYEPGDANPYIDIKICTGMGHARNAIIAASAGALIALEGSHGTLSEIALGLKLGRRVIALGRGESPEGVLTAASPEEAVRMATDG